MHGEPVFTSERRFEVWDWRVGHRGLVLRANPTDDDAERVEVIFKPAYEVCLPALLHGLVVFAVDSTRSPNGSRVLNDWEYVYVLESQDFKGWVIGGTVAGRSDRGSCDDPPLFDGRSPRPGVTELFTRRPPEA
jgi:hypothetical protein